MVAFFYNKSAEMVGLDFHKGIVFPAEPLPFLPHAVLASYRWPLEEQSKLTATVTSQRQPMVQDGAKILLVVHIPLFPPSPLEAAQIFDVIASSGSTPALVKGSVTGQGKPLAICVWGGFGLNLNCQDFGIKLPSGLVQQINTVMTEPTLDDFAVALVNFALENLIGVLVGQALDKVFGKAKSWLVKDLLKKIVKDVVKDIIKRITKEPREKLKKLIQEVF